MKKRVFNMVDLFSGAGGTAMGFWQAAPFNIVGVDKQEQPHYPFTFRRDDAMELLSKRVDVFKNWADVVNVAPPCQGYSITSSLHNYEYPLLITPIRELLTAIDIPYVIENVEEARWDMKDPIMLCGSSFGLRVRRHRLFESNMPLKGLPCDHRWQDEHRPYRIHVSAGRNKDGWRKSGIQPVHGSGHNHPSSNTPDEITSHRSLFYKSVAMGIDWMSNEEINQAIPPAYTRYLGGQVYDYLLANS